MKRCAGFLVVCMAAALRVSASAPLDARFEQRIGEQLPLGTIFTDESGQARPIGSLFGGKPVVLFFDYFRCPQICSLVAAGTVDALRQLKPSAGRDYTVISVSIDPTDTWEMGASRQHEDVLHYGRTGAETGWHVLTGTPAAIRALAAAAGFHYVYDPRSRQYAHPTGIVVVTPRGIVSNYFLGIDFPAPQMASSLRRAARNGTGSPVFSLLFLCFQGDATEGRYGRLIWAILSVAVALTVAAVFGGIVWMLKSERESRAQREEPT